jgi:glycosyltransferase involved in cell wall biosynthesis
VVTESLYVASLIRHLGKFDVVHVFSPSYWAFLLGPVPAMAIGRMLGKAILLNYHSGEAEDHLTNWRGTVRLARLAQRIVVPSGYLQAVFAKFGLEAEAIPNFVNVDTIPYRLRTTLRPVFLSMRNLEPLYNVSCSVRAFAAVQREVPEASLIIAGYGSDRPRIEALVAELSLRNVRFTGKVSPEQMGALLDEADILLNSPDIDNMPLSLIEAQAAGLPIVSTSSGGIPFIVRHESTGLLVDPDDHVAMASAALRLLREPGLARAIGTAARETCLATYTWETVGAAWVRLYQDLFATTRVQPVVP